MENFKVNEEGNSWRDTSKRIWKLSIKWSREEGEVSPSSNKQYPSVPMQFHGKYWCPSRPNNDGPFEVLEEGG